MFHRSCSVSDDSKDHSCVTLKQEKSAGEDGSTGLREPSSVVPVKGNQNELRYNKIYQKELL